MSFPAASRLFDTRPMGGQMNTSTLPSWRRAPGAESGSVEGGPLGSAVSVIVVDAAPGEGPALHRHPYPETFVVQAGRVRFALGDGSVEAEAGHLVVVPPGTPHGFRSLGPGRLRMVAIHAAPHFDTTWLKTDDFSSAGASNG
jgi:quercetin dioxygenase-like cupin family protein